MISEQEGAFEQERRPRRLAGKKTGPERTFSRVSASCYFNKEREGEEDGGKNNTCQKVFMGWDG